MEENLELCKRPENALACQQVGLSAKSNACNLSVGLLEKALLADFPAADAESWDRTGLQVGDPSLPVVKVALALDPTVTAIRQAVEAGANVLVTHHPPFLSAPDTFQPAASVAVANGAGVWEAASKGIALMCFHTALDASPYVAGVLPEMLGLHCEDGLLAPAASCRDAAPGAAASPKKGYGQLCSIAESDAPMTLGQLAARCTAVFGRPPRVWGDLSRELGVVATATGSIGSLVHRALEKGVDCLVCGEAKYHDALDVSEAGMCLIDLGHDVSELPLVGVLAEAVVRAGVPADDVVIINQSSNWVYPEAIRV